MPGGWGGPRWCWTPWPAIRRRRSTGSWGGPRWGGSTATPRSPAGGSSQRSSSLGGCDAAGGSLTSASTEYGLTPLAVDLAPARLGTWSDRLIAALVDAGVLLLVGLVVGLAAGRYLPPVG